jgi:hypothetical protein
VPIFHLGGGPLFVGLVPGEYRFDFNSTGDVSCEPASTTATVVEGEDLTLPLTVNCGSGGLPPGPPIGVFESAIAMPDRSVVLTGWAIDPDSVGSIEVALYVYGAYSSDYVAAVARTDVAAAYPNYGAVHGFSISPGNLQPGPHTFCLVARNVGPGADTSLGCRSFVIPRPADVSFVTALYHDYLDRVPSSSEISFWTTALANGAPLSSIAGGFVTSDEYRLIRIDAAYQSVLGRASDAQGRQWWLAAVKAGALQIDDVAEHFYSSQEYVDAHQNNGESSENRNWIHQLYTDLLHRAPDSSGLDFWEAATLANGRQSVVNGFWASQETAGARVSAMYASYLGRTPDASGLAFWTNVDLTLGDSVTRGSITSSGEYYNLAGTRYPPS